MSATQAATIRKSCPTCAFEVADDDRFCANCGAKLAVERAPRPQLGIDDVAGAYRMDRALRELYFELGAALLKGGRADEAAQALELAWKEPGERPPEADVRLALGLAEQQTRRETAVRHLLEAALADRGARRPRILGHVQSVLDATSALANGEWIVGEWQKRYALLELGPVERAAGMLVVARAHLFRAEYVAMFEALEAALALEPAFARAEVASWLALERLPSALSQPSADSLAVLVGLLRAAGDLKGAVAAIDRALLAVSGLPGYPDAPIYRVKAELLREAGDAKAAADSFYTAGSHFVWRNELKEAIPLLEEAVALDPELVVAHWSLADALTAASHDRKLGDPAELVSRARKSWEAGYARRPPNESDVWAYVARALLFVREAELSPGRSRTEAAWQAVAFIERALVIAPGRAAHLAYLSRFHRQLQNLRTALGAARAAHAADSTSRSALEELIILLINLGDYAEARQRLAELTGTSPSAWTHFVASRLHLYSGQTAEALSAVQKAVELEPESPFYLDTAALIHRCLDDAARADRLAAQILELANESDLDRISIYAWAALERGDLERAERLYTLEAAHGLDQADQAVNDRNRALCWLAAGRTEEARRLFSASLKRPLISEVKLLQGINLRNTRQQLAKAWKKPDEALKALAEFEDLLQGASVAPQFESSRAELNDALAQARPTGAGGLWPMIGASAGLARMDFAEDRFADAAEGYRRLMQTPEEFPEAPAALLAAARELQKVGDRLLAGGEADPAVKSYLTALGHVESLTARRPSGRKPGTAPNAVLRSMPAEASIFEACGDLESRLAYARFHAKDLKLAAAGCRTAVGWYSMLGHPDPAVRLGSVLAALVQSARHYWPLDEWLAALGKELAPTRRALEGALQRIYRLESPERSLLPVTMPIALEIEPSLVPKGDEKEWPILEIHLPDMRNRIFEELGVTVPGVRLRQNELDLPRGGYSILINEVPLVSGNLPADALFCPAAAAVVGGPGLDEAEDPVTGKPGCWVPRQRWEELRKAGCPLWEDPLRYVVRHLEAVLRQDLRPFLGVQETENLIEDWQGKERGRGRVRAAMSDPEARARLRRLLRELVREQVSIADWRPVVEVLIGAAAESDEGTVRKARARLRSSLPGNRPGDVTVDLPPALEQGIARWLAKSDGRTFLAIPPEEVQNLLQEIREITVQAGERCVLVTRAPEMRRFVRRLVEIEFPKVMLLAADERLQAQEPR